MTTLKSYNRDRWFLFVPPAAGNVMLNYFRMKSCSSSQGMAQNTTATNESLPTTQKPKETQVALSQSRLKTHNNNKKKQL